MSDPRRNVVVIVNPISGSGRRRDVARRRAERAMSLVGGLDADIFVTTRRGHARELAQAGLRRGVKRFVAWGGDGTINEVGSALVGSDASLVIVPGGSGNGLARDLRIPFDPPQAFQALFDGRPIRIDAGELDGRFFFNVAGFGLDAVVAHRFAGLERRGFLRYLEITTREMISFAPLEYTVTADGACRHIRPLIIAVANARQYGNGALIAPLAKVDDGELDMTVVDYRPPWRVLMEIRRLFSGTLAGAPGVTMTRLTRATIASATPLVYHVDGEPYTGGLSATALVHPGALEVLVR